MKSLDEIIAFRLRKSSESLEAARALKANGYWNIVVSRLYYAAFYAVSALLLKEGINSKSHNGIKSKFNELFIKTGRVDESLGTVYNKLFKYRLEGDYTDFVVFDEEEIMPLFSKTEDLLQKLRELILDDKTV